MALACLPPQVQHVIELASYLDFFAIYPTVQWAQAALEAREILGLPGQMLRDRYRIEAKQSENDLGVIFEATDTRLERWVTIEVLSPSLGEPITQRLLREARKLARLQSPSIVALFDCDQDRGLSYIVTEHVGNRTLRDVMSQESQPPPLDIAAGILRALECAHSNDVIHKALKPESILLEGNVKLKDFGLTWIEEGQRLIESPVLIGDPHYLAPEQILGQPVDARTDLYALGVILYELFTGHPPFEGSVIEVLEQHLRQPPTPPRQINPALSRSLDHLILKLLAKDPDQRYTSAAEVRHALLDWGTVSASPGEA
jgi:serine/threonine-protein kinase